MPWCNCCSGEEDGIIEGPRRPLQRQFHTSISEYFQNELNNKRIQGKKPAVLCTGNEINFLELDHHSTSLAGEIQKHMGNSFAVTNPEEEILIGLCLPTSEKIISLILAILKLGAGFIPLDPHLPEDLLLLIIHKFRPVMVITDDDGPILGKYDAKSFAEYSKLMSIEEIWMDMELPADDDPKWKDGTMLNKAAMFSSPLNVPPRHRPAIVVPTTGMLGNPRGVRIDHMTILHRIQWEWKEMPFSAQCISGITVPIMTLEGFVQAFTALLKGSTIGLFKRTECVNMTNFIHKAVDMKITRITLTTNNISPFLQAAKGVGKGSEELNRIRYVSCINDTLLPLDLVQDFLSFFSGNNVTLVNYYGSAEVCGLVFFNKLKNVADLKNRSKVQRVVLDRVMDNCCIYILTDYLELTKDGFQGEICVAGHPVALGYVDMKEETEEQRLVDNPHDDREDFKLLYRTGDYGRIEKMGGRRTVFIEGRADSQITVRGMPVNLDEIEQLLKRNEKIQEAYITVYEPSTINQKILGFVLPKTGYLQQALMPSEVSGFLANQIPDYLLPEIKILEEVPLVGKSMRVCQFQLIRAFEEERKSRKFFLESPGNVNNTRSGHQISIKSSPLAFNNWGKLKVPADKLPIAKLLLEAMYKFAAIPVEVAAETLNSNFYQLGGTSLNTLSVLLFLHKNGCMISLQDFLAAKNLTDLIVKMSEMTTNKKSPEAGGTNVYTLKNPALCTIALPQGYFVGPLPADKKALSIEIMSTAYTNRGDLERFHLVEYVDYQEHFTGLWEDLIDDEMSTMVQQGKKVLGCSFNQDFYTPTPETSKTKPLFDVLEYLQELKGSILPQVPHWKETIFEVSWIGTHSSLGPAENVQVITLLMNENLKQASKSRFKSVFVLATNKLVRELCIDAFGFEILDEYPARFFQETQGFRPFRVAPNSLTTSICWKVIDKIPENASTIDPALLAEVNEDRKGNAEGPKG